MPFFELAMATREATLGTSGARAVTVVFEDQRRKGGHRGVHLLDEGLEFIHRLLEAFHALLEPEQADTRLLCAWMEGARLELGMWRRL